MAQIIRLPVQSFCGNLQALPPRCFATTKFLLSTRVQTQSWRLEWGCSAESIPSHCPGIGTQTFARSCEGLGGGHCAPIYKSHSRIDHKCGDRAHRGAIWVRSTKTRTEIALGMAMKQRMSDNVITLQLKEQISSAR
jgi:hypothetical protein